jgi:hypothetical protein
VQASCGANGGEPYGVVHKGVVQLCFYLVLYCCMHAGKNFAEVWVEFQDKSIATSSQVSAWPCTASSQQHMLSLVLRNTVLLYACRQELHRGLGGV